MLPRYLHAAIRAGASVGLVVGSAAAVAQTAVTGQTVPSQVTPQTLRPMAVPGAQTIILPGPSVTTPAEANTSLTVEVGDVRIQDAFPDLAIASEPVLGTMRFQRLSVAQIYAAASELERIYGEAGYPLVRVVVPPQNLVDKGHLRLAVVDGFIETIDVDGVPTRAREVVAKRAAGLVERRHLKLDQLERELLIAGDVPGLKLRSTLQRGNREGGVKLILEGEHDLITGSVGIDNRLSSSLGTRQIRGAVALNSAFGVGEQIYGTVGLAANLNSVANGLAPLTIYGGGAIVPIGVDGVTLNPELTRSTTRTMQTPGVPATIGTFDRNAVRLRAPISLMRKASLYANFSLEEIDQQITAPDFGLVLNRDHYWAFRAGPEFATRLPGGAGLQIGALLSTGLGGRSDLEAAASGIPLSRLGAVPHFAKLSGNVHFSQPLPASFRLDLIGTAQFTGGRPMLRPEQISLDGNDAISAFPFGTFSADQGMTLRGELSHPFAFGFAGRNAVASPYVFGAIGRGWLANATSLEQSVFNAGALGIGVRGSFETAANPQSASLGIELARGFTDLVGVRQGWRTNVNASVTF